MKNRSKKRRAWTAVQVRELSRWRKKKPAGKIAKTLKRTEGATRQKAFRSAFRWIPERNAARLSATCQQAPPLTCAGSSY